MTQELRLLVTAEEIDRTVERLAEEIRDDYGESVPLLIGVLKGGFVFLSDLSRALDIPHTVDFIQPSSYGERGVSGGEVVISRELTTRVEGMGVILVEGIVDSGRTLTALRNHILSMRPSSLRVCTLLQREKNGHPEVEYAGKLIGEGFVVGYGMDYKERYRGLRGVYVLDAPDEPA